MTKAELKNEALGLPPAERLALAEALWASIEATEADIQALPVPQWQRDLLDERLAESEDEPGIPWEQVKAEIWPDLR